MADAPVMAAHPAPGPSFLGRVLGMFNIFIDPRSAVTLIPLPWSWLWPLLLSGIVIGACMYQTIPATLHVFEINPPGNLSVEQAQKALPMIEKTQKISAFVMPVMIGVMLALFAGLLSATCAVMDIRAKFRDNYALLATAGLVGTLGYAAGFAVIKLKGDSIQSMQELRPGFGFDLLLPEGANRLLYAALNYFSFFTIWYIVVLGLAFAALYGTSKGKGFAATAPVWMLALLFAMVGAMFNR